MQRHVVDFAWPRHLSPPRATSRHLAPSPGIADHLQPLPASLLFGVTFNVSSYMSWMVDADTSSLFSWHKRLLGYLQFRKAALDLRNFGAERPKKRWLLKTPMYLGMLKDIATHYPDALIIQTHRSPTEFLGSVASVHAKMWGAASDHIDLHGIGAQQAALAKQAISRGMDTRAEWHTTGDGLRVVDVHLSELKRNPLSVVAMVYRELDMELTTEAKMAMQRWLGSQQVRHGGHKFTLGDFGLSKKQVMEDPMFKRYCDVFNIEGCSRDAARSQNLQPAPTAVEA